MRQSHRGVPTASAPLNEMCDISHAQRLPASASGVQRSANMRTTNAQRFSSSARVSKIDATRRFHCLSLHPATTRIVPSASCWGSTGHRPSHSNRSQTSLGRRPVRPGTARASSKQAGFATLRRGSKIGRKTRFHCTPIPACTARAISPADYFTRPGGLETNPQKFLSAPSRTAPQTRLGIGLHGQRPPLGLPLDDLRGRNRVRTVHLGRRNARN
ncbi:hypothetical protein LXA43DRAFT_192492 [Ganoderma leucocontextum]|nr:hypothetical protein LXA43DRAFT_192492 [Ganoderma leucocontextum]